MDHLAGGPLCRGRPDARRHQHRDPRRPWRRHRHQQLHRHCLLLQLHAALDALSYQATDNVNLFGLFSKGNKPGGFNTFVYYAGLTDEASAELIAQGFGEIDEEEGQELRVRHQERLAGQHPPHQRQPLPDGLEQPRLEPSGVGHAVEWCSLQHHLHGQRRRDPDPRLPTRISLGIRGRLAGIAGLRLHGFRDPEVLQPGSGRPALQRRQPESEHVRPSTRPGPSRQEIAAGTAQQGHRQPPFAAARSATVGATA